jgi:hypothetical protein
MNRLVSKRFLGSPMPSARLLSQAADQQQLAVFRTGAINVNNCAAGDRH